MPDSPQVPDLACSEEEEDTAAEIAALEAKWEALGAKLKVLKAKCPDYEEIAEEDLGPEEKIALDLLEDEANWPAFRATLGAEQAAFWDELTELRAETDYLLNRPPLQ